MLHLGPIPLRHAPALRENVSKDSDIGKQYQDDHPDNFRPTGDVMAAKQIAGHSDEQPKPYHEHKYGKRVGEKIPESEASLEKHRILLSPHCRESMSGSSPPLRSVGQLRIAGDIFDFTG